MTFRNNQLQNILQVKLAFKEDFKANWKRLFTTNGLSLTFGYSQLQHILHFKIRLQRRPIKTNWRACVKTHFEKNTWLIALKLSMWSLQQQTNLFDSFLTFFYGPFCPPNSTFVILCWREELFPTHQWWLHE